MYWGQFDAYAVERLLSAYHNCVFDFGAGIYESRESFDRVQSALAAFPIVVLILPSSNLEESLDILRQRDLQPPADLNFDFNRHFLQHHTYYDLAKHIIYTQGKSPDQTCDEIMRLVG